MSAVIRPLPRLDALMGRRGAPAADMLPGVALAAYAVLFLAVRRATNWRSRVLVAALGSVFAAAVIAKP